MENKDIMAKARESLKGHWGIAVGAVLLYAIYEIVIRFLPPTLGTVISLSLTGAISLGFNTLILALSRRKNAEISQLFEGFSRFWTALAAYLLQGAFIILWMLLLIIPGLIAAYSYAMTFYILADNKSMSAFEAIGKSKEMMKGNKWKLLCLHFRFFWWMLLSIITLGIGLIWLIPYMSVSVATFYNDIKNVQFQEVSLA